MSSLTERIKGIPQCKDLEPITYPHISNSTYRHKTERYDSTYRGHLRVVLGRTTTSVNNFEPRKQRGSRQRVSILGRGSRGNRGRERENVLHPPLHSNPAHVRTTSHHISWESSTPPPSLPHSTMRVVCYRTGTIIFKSQGGLKQLTATTITTTCGDTMHKTNQHSCARLAPEALKGINT